MENIVDNFAKGLSSLNFNESELQVIEQYCQVYFLRKQLHEKEENVDNGIVVSESEDDDPLEIASVGDPLDNKGKDVIKKRRAFIKRKAIRDIKMRIAERRFLKRRSKKVKRIENECPDIGRVIEDFVRKRGIGADAWRRTGVLTFDGNRCPGKKVTFRRIQAHLEARYERKFS